MTITVYGIKNCSTMKKAFDWFDSHSLSYEFHDYKKRGIDEATLARWCDALGWASLVNTRGTTWRKLDDACRTIDSAQQAIALMVAQPSLIKRPVIESAQGALLIGFDADTLATTFGVEENR